MVSASSWLYTQRLIASSGDDYELSKTSKLKENRMDTRTNIVDSPADFLALLPKELLPAPVSKAFKKAVARLGELSVDRDALIQLVRDRSLVPAEIADVMMLETTKHLGRRVKLRETGIQVKWLESAKYGLPITPMSAADYEELTGGRRLTNEKDLEEFIRRALPDVPKFWTRSNGQAIRSDLIKGSLENRSYWDCLVAHLGFWAALVLIGSHIVLICLLGAGWQIALKWAIIYSGVATAYVLLQCLVNPNYN
jgi:hypothetical protein